jgi:hypothetical protein
MSAGYGLERTNKPESHHAASCNDDPADTSVRHRGVGKTRRGKDVIVILHNRSKIRVVLPISEGELYRGDHGCGRRVRHAWYWRESDEMHGREGEFLANQVI